MELNFNELDSIMRKSIDMLEAIGYKMTESYHWKLSKSKTNFGYCNYNKKEIGISVVVSQYHSEAEVLNTCLHELCHALAPDAGHTGKWKIITNRVNNKYNMNIERCYTPTEEQKSIESLQNKYRVTCQCGQVFMYKKKTKRIITIMNNTNSCHCPKCKSKKFKIEVL